MLKSLVIIANSRMKGVGDLLAIARSEAKRKEHIHYNVDVKCIHYIPECGVYVAIYEVAAVQKPRVLRHEVTMANNE